MRSRNQRESRPMTVTPAECPRPHRSPGNQARCGLRTASGAMAARWSGPVQTCWMPTRRPVIAAIIRIAPFALGKGSVQPDLYGTELTFFAYTVLLLGGAARVLGPVIGSALFWLVLSLTDNVLNQAIDAGYISSSIINSNQVGQIRFIMVGVALMLLMIFRPQGIFGDRKELALDGR